MPTIVEYQKKVQASWAKKIESEQSELHWSMQKDLNRQKKFDQAYTMIGNFALSVVNSAVASLVNQYRDGILKSIKGEFTGDSTSTNAQQSLFDTDIWILDDSNELRHKEFYQTLGYASLVSASAEEVKTLLKLQVAPDQHELKAAQDTLKKCVEDVSVSEFCHQILANALIGCFSDNDAFAQLIVMPVLAESTYTGNVGWFNQLDIVKHACARKHHPIAPDLEMVLFKTVLAKSLQRTFATDMYDSVMVGNRHIKSYLRKIYTLEFQQQAFGIQQTKAIFFGQNSPIKRAARLIRKRWGHSETSGKRVQALLYGWIINRVFEIRTGTWLPHFTIGTQQHVHGCQKALMDLIEIGESLKNSLPDFEDYLSVYPSSASVIKLLMTKSPSPLEYKLWGDIADTNIWTDVESETSFYAGSSSFSTTKIFTESLKKVTFEGSTHTDKFTEALFNKQVKYLQGWQFKATTLFTNLKTQAKIKEPDVADLKNAKDAISSDIFGQGNWDDTLKLQDAAVELKNEIQKQQQATDVIKKNISDIDTRLGSKIIALEQKTEALSGNLDRYIDQLTNKIQALSMSQQYVSEEMVVMINALTSRIFTLFEQTQSNRDDDLQELQNDLARINECLELFHNTSEDDENQKD